MKCLITGINGFLAGYIYRNFQDLGAEVYGVYHSSASKKLEKNKQFKLQLPDEKIYKIIREIKPDVLVHTAGTASVRKSMEDPYLDFKLGVPATAMLLDAIRQGSPDTHLVFLSSAAVYGNPATIPVSEKTKIDPISPYGYHKHLGEQLCEEFAHIYGVRSTVLRIFSAYGPGLEKQVVYDLIKKSMKAQQEQTPLQVIGTGEESRDFIHAEDIAHAVGQVINVEGDCRECTIYNLANGREVKIADLVRIILEVMEEDIDVEYSMKVREGDPLRWAANIDKIHNIGFKPKYTFEDGIQQLVREINR